MGSAAPSTGSGPASAARGLPLDARATAEGVIPRASRPLAAAWWGRLRAVVVVGAGAAALRAILGVGFANYDTLYALVWGQQLARGEAPQYALPIAPTPHPLVELLGVVLAPLGPHVAATLVVWAGYVALAACGYLVFRLGSAWFNRPVGALAALILLTRTPILSYGSRAYIDVPFLALVLAAMLVESRRHRAGAPVLALLALAGLLRPEAWLFSGLYWLYVAAHGRIAWDPQARALRRPRGAVPARTVAQLGGLAALTASAPILWVLSDLLASGDALWSLSHTQRTASTLDRVTGIANVPEYIPRRIGEILRPVGLAGAAVGAALSLAWMPRRARPGVAVGAVAVVVFAGLAIFGLPIDTRYAFLAAAITCVFCAVGAFGWLSLPRAHGDRRRRAWALAGTAVLIALAASIPGQYGGIHTQLRNLARQQRAEDDLVALVHDGSIQRACEPVGVPNHALIPLLALWLETRPGRVASAQVRRIAHGTYIEAAAPAARELVLDPHEPRRLAPSVPAGFLPAAGNRSWRVFERCP